MGCGESKPPPIRTSVRNYPGSQGYPQQEDANPATFKGPRSDYPTMNTNASTLPSFNSEEYNKHQAVPKPIVITEEEIFNKTSDDRDVILDDGDPLSGTEPPPEITTKEINKQHSAFGREEQMLHARQSEHVVPVTSRPEVASGELWTDPDYPKSAAMRGIKGQVRWIRPKEFLKKPCLYSNGTCCYDIAQGQAGTCWFLSILQSLADQPEYLKHIIPEGSYRIGTPEYDGIFHCRFWRFDKWVDVYVDDFIPVEDGKPWGARSKTDPNELWVTLIEKAFSKYHGSYQSVHGGTVCKAFTILTAGIAEYIWLDTIKPKDLYSRAKNTLACGSILAAIVVKDRDERGLTGHHAYSITAVSKVTYMSKYVSLIRLRNPWGEREGEWTGPWSDRSSEWKQLSAKDKEAIQHKDRGDGEFWMSFTHFYQHFGTVTLCNYTPDVDQDGQTDDMNKSWTISGEWKGEGAAGYENKIKNPKFEFEIPEEGIPKQGTPVVLELQQPPPTSGDKASLLALRPDLFKVESVSGRAGSQHRLLHEVPSGINYIRGESTACRYTSLTPGKYLVIPHYCDDPGAERQFVLRIFSQVTLICREVKEDSGFFIRDRPNTGFEYEGQMQTTGEVSTHHGAWVAGHNAGGECAYTSSAGSNPQYEIYIRHPGELIEQPCSVSLFQDVTKPYINIGYRIYRRERTQLVPLDSNTVNQNFNDCPANTRDDTQLMLFRSPQVNADFMLMPGGYAIIVYTFSPNQEASYVLQIATKNKANTKEHNVVQRET